MLRGGGSVEYGAVSSPIFRNVRGPQGFLSFVGVSISTILVLVASVVIGCLISNKQSVKAATIADGFHISQFLSGSWKELYVEPFAIQYQTKTFPLTPQHGQVFIRINEEVTSYADIEFAHLTVCGQDVTPQYAQYVANHQSVLDDILYDDHNVAVNHEEPIEILWQLPSGCTQDATLTLKANEYESPEKNAFRFPSYGIVSQRYTFQNNGSLDVDGELNTVDDKVAPNYSPFWLYGTGHPSNTTYIYVKDDAKYVYIAADVTGDNTNEQGPGSGWFKVDALNAVSGKMKEYLVDYDHDTYGTCGFGETSKVPYRHANCEMRIPKSELVGNALDFVLWYYGTGSASPTLQFLNVGDSSKPSNTEPVIKGNVTAEYGAGNITSVAYAIQNLATGEYVVSPYDGTCTADDGAFDSTNENFTCITSQPLTDGTNYQYTLYTTDDQSNNGTMTFGFTPYPYDYAIFSNFGDSTFGNQPIGNNSLIASNGIFYGIANGGGVFNGGTIFSIQADGSDPSALQSFGSGTDGSSPVGSPVQSGAILYGMTSNGGVRDNGVIFSVDQDGTQYSILHRFSYFDVGDDRRDLDGKNPHGSLLKSGDFLYGMTTSGGTNNLGTIFSLNVLTQEYSQLYSFSGADGASPYGSLILHDNLLYGMTSSGGANNAGTIFSFNPDPTQKYFQLRYSFDPQTCGSDPNNDLVQSGSLLYGTTSQGASFYGAIFSFDPDTNVCSPLHTFHGGLEDGNAPSGSPILINNTFYGVTLNGGDNDQGTVYSLNTQTSGFSLLHAFGDSNYDGGAPAGALLNYGNTLYGFTREAGSQNDIGTIFSVSIPSSSSSFTTSSSSSSSLSSSEFSSSSSSAQVQESGGGMRGQGTTTIYSPDYHASSVSSPAHETASSSSCDVAHFLDVTPSAWYRCYVSDVSNRKIFTGYRNPDGTPTGNFGPGNPITYAELAKAVLAATGQNAPALGKPQNASARGSWSAPYIAEAEQLHWTVYTSSLAVNADATRGAVIQTLLEAFGITIEKNLPNPFKDLQSSNPYAAAIETAQKLGIISGDTDANGKLTGTVRPTATITRAEVAKIVSLILEKLGK